MGQALPKAHGGTMRGTRKVLLSYKSNDVTPWWGNIEAEAQRNWWGLCFQRQLGLQ